MEKYKKACYFLQKKQIELTKRKIKVYKYEK